MKMEKENQVKPVVFLDRDGVILDNLVEGKKHSTNNAGEILYVPNAILGLRKMQSKGYDLFVISNQGGVGLGIMTKKVLDEINNKMLEDLAREGVTIKGLYCCLHKPEENCLCRKPALGLLLQAQREYDLNLEGSYMIGDRTSDIELGNRANIKTILVQTGKAGKDGRYPDAKIDFIAKDLLDAADYLPRL
jgi:D-glycero-D-manno-heptose 1,7-bisphosphate phosphatase